MIEIIRKDIVKRVRMSDLKKGDMFRCDLDLDENIYIFFEKCEDICTGINLKTGNVWGFKPTEIVIPVRTTLIYEDMTFETDKEKGELKSCCKCSSCNQ